MERLRAACTPGLAAESCRAGSAEFMAADTTAPPGKTKPSKTTLRYLGSTRRKVAMPTPMDTYAIIAARIGHGNNCAIKSVRPLQTAAMKMIGVQRA